jgi:tetratricopeptide (TPR) repeat protein
MAALITCTTKTPGVDPFYTKQTQDPTVAAQIGRLRQKYAGTASGGAHPSLTNQHAHYGQAENNVEVSKEDMEAYERLSRVKICASCQGQGTKRLQFNHYYVDSDCTDCDGDGYYRLKTSDERIEKAKELKKIATVLFKEKEYKKADEQFQESLATIVSFSVGAEQDCLRIALLSNRAACALKLEDWAACCEHCHMVLKQDEQNIKALWRLSVGYEKLMDVDNAVACLEKMLQFEPGHTRGTEALNRLKL